MATSRKITFSLWAKEGIGHEQIKEILKEAFKEKGNYDVSRIKIGTPSIYQEKEMKSITEELGIFKRGR